MTSLFKVIVNDVLFLSAQSDKFQQSLQLAHGKNVTFCLCNKNAPIALVVKHYNAGKNDSHFGLALWPETGHDHEVSCFFFGNNEQELTHVEADSKPAFEQLENGKSRAYLATALKIINKNIDAIRLKRAQAQSSGDKRMRAGELSLLLKLWRQAGLNFYKGYVRTWFFVVNFILKTSDKIIINSQGEALSQYLLIGASKDDKLLCSHNASVLSRAKHQYTRLFVIGRLSKYSRDKKNTMLMLRDFGGIPKISISVDLLDQLFEKKPFLKNTLDTEDGNLVIIACIEPTQTDWWKTRNIEAIATNDSMIPFSNNAEKLFSEILVKENRKFVAPIYFDEQAISNKRPEFILFDTQQRTYCEVFDTSHKKKHDDSTQVEQFHLRHSQYFAWYELFDSGTQFSQLPPKWAPNNAT